MSVGATMILAVAVAANVLLMNAMTAAADRIVFVHGFIGFGPDELLGVGYWGFPKIFGSGQDYINLMRSKGHQVLYASVGPISSNWDRACELYAQIMGTVVDYGAAHSAKNGHLRFGKDYTGKGFFPQWSADKKISFISHSMGGNTVRMLEHLLQNGDAAEYAATGESSSLLFKPNKPGGNNWIHSLHMISGPHDGTTLLNVGQDFISLSQETLLTFGAVAGIQSLDAEWLYNFDLDQFGLVRNPGESFKSYYQRVFSSKMFDSTFTDNALYDLSVGACWDFNSKSTLAYPGTYYFTYSTGHTHLCDIFGNQCPDLTTEIFMAPTALIMGHIGSNTCISSHNYCFNKMEWAPNDGIVPSRSSVGPQLGIRNYVVETQRPTKCGFWSCQLDNSALSQSKYYTAHYQRDHTQIIGLRFNLLEPDASGGVYNDIGDTIDAIKSPDSSQFEAHVLENFLPDNGVNIAAIVAPVAVGSVLLAGMAAVIVRRRRSASRSSATNQGAEDAKRSSIIALSHMTSAENPMFLAERGVVDVSNSA